jgi:hypothetical protein
MDCQVMTRPMSAVQVQHSIEVSCEASGPMMHVGSMSSEQCYLQSIGR